LLTDNPPAVKILVLGLKLNAVAVVLMLGVWFPVPTTNTGKNVALVVTADAETILEGPIAP
jgi:hypothetical protein